ncbi:hypothetical protein Ct9H90mP29_10960 [bacterium]|nr:MAG: hypothetical protein Ct9H90mP29_10960 [bacterium]
MEIRYSYNKLVLHVSLLMRMNEEQWDQGINTNLKAAFIGMKAAIRP